MELIFEKLLYGMQFRRLLEKEFDSLQKKHSCCKIDMQILSYLLTAGEKNTSKDIRDLGLYTKGHISQSLNRLQKKKLVHMVQDKDDRRCMHILLNQEAMEMVNQIKEAYDRINEEVFRGVTEEEIAVLQSVAEKINNNIRNVISVI